MKEHVVRRFFEGEYELADLEADYPGTVTTEGPPQGPFIRRFHVEPMSVEFQLEPAHVIKLIDGVLAGKLRVEILQTICEWLEAAAFDHFVWDTDTPDGERLANGLFWLGTPEINYPLTREVLSKIRHYLQTGENLLTRADTKVPKAGA